MSLVGRSRSLTLTIEIEPAGAQAFAAGIGQPYRPDRLPTTLPVRFLTRPEIIDAIRDLAADRPGALPVHELQTVETLAPLVLGAPLQLSVKAERTDDIHVAIDADLADAGGKPLARLHSLLRLIA